MSGVSRLSRGGLREAAGRRHKKGPAFEGRPLLSSAVGSSRSFRMKRNGLLGDFEVGEFPAGLAGLEGDFVEGGDLGFTEEKTGVLGGTGGGGGFELAR